MHHDSLCACFVLMVTEQLLYLQNSISQLHRSLGRIKRDVLWSMRRDYFMSLKCNILMKNYHITCSMNFHKPNIILVIITQTKKQYMSSHTVASFVPNSSHHFSPLSRFLTTYITSCRYWTSYKQNVVQCIFTAAIVCSMLHLHCSILCQIVY